MFNTFKCVRSVIEICVCSIAQEVHPGDLKASVVEVINKLLAPIIQHFKQPEMQKLLRTAYPAEAKTSG